MLPQTLTGSDVLPDLINHRADVSVTIYLPASRVPSETNTARLALKNLAADAADRLRERGVRTPRIEETVGAVRELQDDEEFWRSASDAIALFASPGDLRAYTFRGELSERLTVADRFDVGPLVRAITSTDEAWILSVSRGDTHLYSLVGDRATEVPLALPDDIHTYLVHAENYGDMDRDRAEGRKGDRPEFQKYCKVIDEAVVTAISGSTRPLILVASDELERAYRTENSYEHLLEEGIRENPASLTPADLAARAVPILDEHTRRQLSQWRETFGSRRANGLATSRLAEVALAATAAAVEELLFNPDVTILGTIDDQGVLTRTEDGNDVIDEIVARVLSNGGTVKGVRNRELVDGSPVAAMLRFPLGAPGRTDPLG